MKNIFLIKKVNKNFLTKCVLIIILIIGINLRFNNLYTWPREGATFDEYAWTFLGINLINTGIPVSWSPHSAYSTTRDWYNQSGVHFRLVKPYLEHPPLFGLIAGGYAKLCNVNSFDDVSVKRIRTLSLILGSISIIMIFALASLIYGSAIGLLSAGIYAVIPTVVAGSRLVQNENFFIPLFLLLLYCIRRYELTNSSRWIYFACLISFLLPLAKIPWIAAPIGGFGYFLYKKSYRSAAKILTSSFIAIFMYIFWGLYWDKVVFLKLMALQTSRYDITFDGFLSLVTNPIVTDRLYTDGWILFGWFAIFVSLFYKTRARLNIIIFGFLAYFGMYIFAIPNEPGHGWYRYPFYPFMAIAIAQFIREYFNRNFLLTFMFLIIVGLPLFEHVWTPLFGFSFIIYRLYILVTSINILLLFPVFQQFKKINTVNNYLLFTFITVFSCIAGIFYNEF